MKDRGMELLKAAKALLEAQRDAGVLIDNIITVHYDDVDCDGYCLLNDIKVFLEYEVTT